MAEELATTPSALLETPSGQKVTSAVFLLEEQCCIIGTSGGNLVVFTSSDSHGESGAWSPLCDVVLHRGRVCDIAVSSAQLVATAGHDATCAVVPLSGLVGGHAPPPHRRFSQHTAPVAKVLFFSDGLTFAALGVDGHLLIANAASGTTLSSIFCGFAACCMTPSVDESILYVGGHSVAQVDLCAALRPPSHLAAAGQLIQASASPTSSASSTVRQPLWNALFAYPDDSALDGLLATATTLASTACVTTLQLSPSGDALNAVIRRKTAGGGAAVNAAYLSWALPTERRGRPTATSAAATASSNSLCTAAAGDTASGAAAWTVAQADVLKQLQRHWRGRSGKTTKSPKRASRMDASASLAPWRSRRHGSILSSEFDTDAVAAAAKRCPSGCIGPSLNTPVRIEQRNRGPLDTWELEVQLAVEKRMGEELQMACDELVAQIRQLKAKK